MNWNAKEFIWLDWVVLVIGIVLVGVAVYLSIMKDKKKMKGDRGCYLCRQHRL